MKIVVLDGYTTNPGDLDWHALDRLGELTVYDWTEKEQIVARAEGAAAVFVNKTRLDADTLDALPELKYVGIMATGYDTVDIAAAKQRSIVVTNVPEYATDSVAQHAFALILELCSKAGMHSESVKTDRLWCRQTYNSYWLSPLMELAGKTLGILGMGKIGQRAARIGRGFGMRIIAYDAYPAQLEDVEWVTLETLFQTSDVISLHCPLFPSTRGIVNKDTLAMMKPSAYIVNTSRGPLVIEEDLAAALNSGVIAGAGLDVLGAEPPTADNPLLTAKNTIITPHVGWATIDARRRLIECVADNYTAFLQGNCRNTIC